MSKKNNVLRLIGVAEDLLEQLINATEDFDDPISEEEIEEYQQIINIVKGELK